MKITPHFHFLTLFPDTIHPWMNASIIGRARKAGIFDYTAHQLRDYSQNKHRTVDDVAYGGGGGMVLSVEPLVAAVEAIRQKISPHPLQVICFSPAGEKMSQPVIERFRPTGTNFHYLLVCGHYEGIDQRFLDHWVDVELSLGDFVITGGELPALVFTDALLRQLEGTLPEAEASRKESFKLTDQNGKLQLEYPHYTRPADFRGHGVPAILTSGDHGAIEKWRQEQAAARTRARRADLLR